MNARTNARALLGASLGVLLAGSAMAQDAGKVQIGNGQKEFPESITSTADGTLYAGSLTQGTVFKVAPGAQSTQFIAAPTEGPKGVLGVLADEAQGTLYVCYADLAAFAGGEALPSVLGAFDLSSGSAKGSYPFTGKSFCNDIATTADGTAYAADTAGGRVVKLAAGGSALEDFFADPALAGVDGISFGPDGAMYLNNVMTNKLYRLDMGTDGKAGKLTELKTSAELKGPDGMRFGDDGKLYLAENAAGQADQITIDGDNATIKPVITGLTQPTAVTKVGNTLWVLEAQLSKLQGGGDPGPFYAHSVDLSAVK